MLQFDGKLITPIYNLNYSLCIDCVIEGLSMEALAR